MRISALILMSPLPAAWIAVGSLLLLLVVVMTILFLLKSREVSTLKKQCDELRDTMRMMRYEEANLARMLHTASKPVEPIETPEEEDVEGNADGLEVLESQESLEEHQEKEQPQEQQEQEVQEEQEIEEVEEEQEELPVVGDIEEPQAIALQKQPISERRSALPVDLFSAWFAENEEEQEQPLVASQTEVAEQPVDVVAIQEEPATEEVLPGEEAVVLPAVENEQEMVEAPQETELNKDDERFCRKLERIVTTRMRNPNLNIDIIAAQFGIGRTNFYRKVREVMGMSPNDYLRKCRMERAAELLRSTEDNVGEVCAQVGMPDAQYFSRVFKAYFGVSPSVYRETNNQ